MLPSKQLQTSILTLAVLALAAGRADAQLGRTYLTLEARIAEADGVVVGPVEKVARTVIVPPGGKAPNGVVFPDGIVEYTALVKADEVLKGDFKENLTLTQTASASDNRFDEWAKARTPFLWFVSRQKDSVHVGGPLRLGAAVPAEAGYRSGIAPPVFSADFTVLKDGKEILARARAYAKQSTKPLPIHRIPIPRAVADRCSPSGDFNVLCVPVEPALERTAKRLIASPQDFLPKKDERDSRARSELGVGGVDALRHFKSAENTALLRSLLDDPTETLQTAEAGAPKGRTVKRYPLRAKAYEILTDWGVDVPRPVTEVVVPKKAKRD
jgi:hypothetical protein